MASASVSSRQKSQKGNYDKKVFGKTISIGDKVLVRNVAFKTKHKLADKWQDTEYEVISQPNPDLPVFVVKSLDDRGVSRTLHRNMLLPLLSTGQVIKQRSKSTVQSESSDSSGEEDSPVVLRVRPIPAPRLSLNRKHNQAENELMQEGTELDRTIGNEIDRNTDDIVISDNENVEPVVNDNDVQTIDKPVVLRRSSRQSCKPDRYDPSMYKLSVTQDDTNCNKLKDCIRIILDM